MNTITRNTVFLLVIGFVYFLSIIYIVLASIPYNPLRLSNNEKKTVLILAPQGWSFFTKNPREEEILLYKKVKNTWVKWDKSLSDPAFCFGASRVGKKIISEKFQIANQIKDSTSWTNGDLANSMFFVFNKLPVLKISALSKDPILSGDFILVKQKNVPWAWSKKYNCITMPYKCVHVFIAPLTYKNSDAH